MNAKEILQKLEGVMETTNGWQACCPAHHDEKPSLCIAVDDGKTLLHCQAGCRKEDILKKLGLEMRDLFPPDPSASTVVNRYDYQDEKGELLFQIQRHKPKAFTARRQDGNGGWINNLDGVRRVPYRLPDVVQYNSPWMTEGEKDCDTCRNAFRLPATTTPFGAGNWRPEYARYFAGKKNMGLVPHKDDAGQKHMQTIACDLFGVVKELKIVDLPFGNDLTEYYELGGTREGLIQIKKRTLPVTADQVREWQQPTDTSSEGVQMKSLRQLMNQKKEKVKWVVEGLLRTAGTSLLTAKPKVGKSTFVRCLAFAVGTGRDFLGRHTKQGAVLYLAPQELESEVKDHFERLGGTGEEPIHVCCSIGSDFNVSILQGLTERYKPALVIMDQLLHMIDIRDENKYALVTRALQPFEALARKTGVHICMTYHSGMSERADAADEVLGSTAYFGAVDTLLIAKSLHGSRTIQSRQRYKNEHGDLEETVLAIDEKSGAVSLGAPRNEIEAERIADAILNFLDDHKNTQLTEDDLLAKVSGGHALKRTALRQLVLAKEIGRSGKGVRGNPYKYSARDFHKYTTVSIATVRRLIPYFFHPSFSFFLLTIQHFSFSRFPDSSSTPVTLSIYYHYFSDSRTRENHPLIMYTRVRESIDYCII